MLTFYIRVDKSTIKNILYESTRQRTDRATLGEVILTPKMPWELNPALEKQHLITVAKFIAEVRNSVVDLHDEDLGDTNQSLGFRAYECCRSRINNAVLVEKIWPFLSIVRKGGKFTFAIGKTPVRFYKGSPSCIEERRQIPCSEAVKQMSLLELDNPDYSRIIWYFVVETDQFKYAESVTFAGYLDGAQVSAYEIPLDGLVPLLSTISTSNNEDDVIDKSVKIPKPKVSPKKPKQDDDQATTALNNE